MKLKASNILPNKTVIHGSVAIEFYREAIAAKENEEAEKKAANASGAGSSSGLRRQSSGLFDESQVLDCDESQGFDCDDPHYWG